MILTLTDEDKKLNVAKILHNLMITGDYSVVDTLPNIV